MICTRLYLITPPQFELEIFALALEQALGAGAVAAVQLRLKDCDDAQILRIGERLGPIVQNHGAAFIVNDRPDLAHQLNADGAHIGQSDMPYDEARAILGPKKTLGVTAHNSRHLAIEAAEKGADYVAFGAFFPTATKETKFEAEPGILEWWSQIMEIPCVAIGGITPANALALCEAGADFLAVSSGVWNYPDGPAEAVKAFNRIISKANRKD
jgi:thiamine-phosphate pyrophosphorylase